MRILPRMLLIEQNSLVHDARSYKLGKYTTVVVSPSRSSLSAAWRIWNNPRDLSFARPDPASAPYSWPVLGMFGLFWASKAGAIMPIDRLLFQTVREGLTASSSLSHFTPDQESIIRRFLDPDDDPVSSHELLLRAFMSLSWVWANVLILETYHAILVIVFVVILRRDYVGDWPPLFGTLAEPWTVRRFWGKFWHRVVMPTFTSCARPLLRYLLQYGLVPVWKRQHSR